MALLKIFKLGMVGAGASVLGLWPTLAQAEVDPLGAAVKNAAAAESVGEPDLEVTLPPWVIGVGSADGTAPSAMPGDSHAKLERFSLDEQSSAGQTLDDEQPLEVAVATGAAQDLMPLMSGLTAAESVVEIAPEAANQVAQVRPSTDGEGWEYVLSPYLFVPFSVRSDITVGGVTRSVSAGLGDIFNLDRIFSGALRFEARQPQYGFFADASHIFVREGRGVTGFPLPPVAANAILAQTGIPIPPGTPVDASVTGTGRTTTVSLGGYYRLVDQVLGDGDARAAYPRLMVDPYLGVRLVSLNGSLDFDVALAGATRTARLSDSTVLFKPMLGAQVGLELSEQWALGLRGDLSGLAIGADDSFAWGLWAGARYQFSPGWALQMGYQYKDANYSLGQGATRFSIDQTQQGIWTGLDIRL